MSTVANLPGVWSYLRTPPPTLEADGSTWRGKITFATETGNVVPFIQVVSGLPPVTITTAFGTMTRIIPLIHPEFPWMLADKLNVEYFGTPSETSTSLLGQYSHARVHVEFKSQPFGISGDTAFMRLTTKGAGIYAAVPGRKLKFASGEVIDQNAGAFVGQTSYVLTLYQTPTLNDSVVEPLLNHLNNATFFNKPAGQMRFDAWDAEDEVKVGGVVTFTKQLTFTYQDHHWNQIYRSDGVLEAPTDPAGNTLYQAGNLSLLLGS